MRTRYFGLKNPRSSEALAALNRQLWVLARVVLHPTYRGASIAAAFVRRACESCPVPWIETLTAMGGVNPFFERAGFRRVGVVDKPRRGCAYSNHRRVSGQAHESGPRVYYVFDNRKS